MRVERPRILILSAYYFPIQGGSETHARALAVYLHQSGFDVRVVTKRLDAAAPVRAVVDEIPVHRVWPPGARSGVRKWLMLPFAFAKIVALRREFDVIYCAGYQGIGLAALAAGWVLRRPVVLRSGNLGVLAGTNWDAPLARWGIRGDHALVRWLKARVRGLYVRADAMACNCRDNEREALELGMPRDRVVYLPNAVDLAAFRPARDGERAAVRAEAGWPAEAFICLYVGRLSVEKGIQELLEAWSRVQANGAVLILVGPDMPGHPLDAGPAARRYVETHGLGDRVRFHGASKDVARLLRGADLYVQPSHYEAFSNAIIEAMATGLPIVASRVGGILDCLVDGENGLLATPADAADLARVLQQAIDDPALRDRLAAAARETVARDFDEQVIFRRFEDLFESTAVVRRAEPSGSAGKGGPEGPPLR